ncbi:MAG: helix-turn-helix domain-containing protein, partial [Opitutaceae bacterium]|nr:helix-turn-helix domain-containing protein [Opitutaceae bacterium]
LGELQQAQAQQPGLQTLVSFDSLHQSGQLALAAARYDGQHPACATAAGRTFWAVLNDLRLAHAAMLLQRGEHSIMGVMFSCGFNDVSHFYRMFRQRYGAAPRAWLARSAR